MTRACFRFAGLCLAFVTGCAAPPAREGGFPVLTAADTDPASGYERSAE